MSRHRIAALVVASTIVVAAIDFWTSADLVGSILFTFPLALCALHGSRRLLWSTACAAAILTIAAEFWGYHRTALSTPWMASTNRAFLVASLFTMTTFVDLWMKSLDRRLHEVIDNIGDAFFTLDRDWRFTYVNAEAERLLARGRSQLLGRNIWTEFQQAVGTTSDQQYRRAMAEGVIVRFEQFYPPLHRWLAAEAHPTRDGLAVYFRDVTERRHAAERNLARMESRYRGLLEAAPDAMVVVNEVGEIVLLNVQAEKQLGYSRDELLGQPVKNIIPDGFAERLIADGTRTAAEALAQQIGTGIELRARRKNGSEFPIELMLSPLDSEGGILVTAAIRDISIRKAAEMSLALMEGRYRGLLEAAPDAMILVNAGGEIVLANIQAKKQFGFGRGELIGHSVRKIIPEGLMELVIESLAQSADPALPDEVRTAIELTGRHQDGSYFPIEIMLSPLKSAEGTLVTAAIRDITTRKKADAVLQQTLDELNRSNEELGQFAYIASHDLQEPLRMVASYTQLLSKRYKGRLDADADEFIAFAVDGANRMQRLIQDLLAYSRVGTRGRELAATSSEEALALAIRNLHEAIEQSGALVTHAPLPTVRADGGQLVQLFQNLVGNAIKYQVPGIPRIHISSVEGPEGDHRMANQRPPSSPPTWTFSVTDNGLGIEPRYFEKIFGMFQRLHRREEFEGTGIGLAICKKIVERHGGKISVESQLGLGSTFRFSLAGSLQAP